MLRSVGSVVAGYAVMVVLVMLGTFALAAALIPGGMGAMRERMKSGQPMPAPSATYLASNLALSLAAAVVGGWVTLRLAQRAPAGHLGALCVVLVVMGVVSARMPGSELQPGWYRFAIPLVGIAGVGLSLALVPRPG